MSLNRNGSGAGFADAATLKKGSTTAAVPGLLSWQLLVLGFVAGGMASLWPLPGVACLAAVIMLDARSRRPVVFYAALLVMALIGWGHTGSTLPNGPQLQPIWLDERASYQLTGVVDTVEGKPGKRWQVVLTDVSCSASEGKTHVLESRVVWYWHGPTFQPQPGQRLSLKTTVHPVAGFKNPGSWDYGLFWRMQGVGYTVYCNGDKGLRLLDSPETPAVRLRSALRNSIVSGAPEGQGRALLLALLMGDRFELEPSSVDLLRKAGLAHTLALSGLHLGFVAALGWVLAWLAGRLHPTIYLRLPRPRLAVLLAAPAVLSYVWLGQASPSLVRAALMFGFWGLLLLRGRGRVVLDGLFMAVACILLVSPLSLFDIRLQLSVTAVAGIALLYPRLQRHLPRGGFWGRILGWALGLLAVSLCANLALLPITARLFGTLVPNLLPNLFWLPLLGFAAMPVGMLGMLLGAVPGMEWFGAALVTFSSNLLEWMFAMVGQADAFGLLPSWQLLRPFWPELLGVGILLVCVFMYAHRPRKMSWGALFVGVALLFWPHLATVWCDAQDDVRLEVLDVGQGQSVVIITPGGRRVLIDGGGLRSRTLETGRDVVAPYLTLGRAPRLDLVLLSHPHMDHYKGLFHILENFQVVRFGFNGKWPSGEYGAQMRLLLERRGLIAEAVIRGNVFDLGSDVRLEALMPLENVEPPSTNDGSLVLILRRGERNLAVLPGDAEEWNLTILTQQNSELQSDILLLPHHGSRTGLVPAFFARVEPRAVLSSCGRFGKAILPSPEVLALPELEGVVALDTASQGLLRAAWSGAYGYPLVKVAGGE